MLLELALKRRSVRRYKEVPVEEEKLDQVLEAGRVAPSACNIQPWHFIVVRDESMRRKVAETYSSKYEWIAQAPVIVVVCGDHSKSWKREDGKDYCDVDMAIAVDHMILQAADLDLGTCWIGWFDKNKLSKVLEVPPNIEPVLFFPLGYADDETGDKRAEKNRKALNEVIRWDSFR